MAFRLCRTGLAEVASPARVADSSVSGSSSHSSPGPPVLNDAKLQDRAHQLHKQVSLMNAPMLAPTDTMTINMHCIDKEGLICAQLAGRSNSNTQQGRPHRHSESRRQSETSTALVDRADSHCSACTSHGPHSPTSNRRASASIIRVQSIRAPKGLKWSESRRALEVLLTDEQSCSAGMQGPDFKSHEERLNERLTRLNLEMVLAEGDGNCQFRSVSMELYGTQEHHTHVRKQAVKYIRQHRSTFECFLGEDFDEYLDEMAELCTWGDELTLRAICEAFGVVVRVLTSDEQHWYLTYQPSKQKLDREIFLTYIAPLHYNSVRRLSPLRTLSVSALRTMSSSLRRMGTSQSTSSSRCSVGTPPSSRSSVATVSAVPLLDMAPDHGTGTGSPRQPLSRHSGT